MMLLIDVPNIIHHRPCVDPSSTDEVFSIVGDVGTQTSKFGYAGGESPSAVFSSVGIPLHGRKHLILVLILVRTKHCLVQIGGW